MAYLRAGCDATKAVASLQPELRHEQQQRKGWRMLQHPDIRQAISDKLQQREEKYDTSRIAIVERLFSLLAKVERLPDTQLSRAIKLELEVLKELSAISGHHIQRHEVDSRSVSINLVGMTAPAIDDVNANAEQEQPELLEQPKKMFLPHNEDPAIDLTFDLSDLDDISSDEPEDIEEDPEDE